MNQSLMWIGAVVEPGSEMLVMELMVVYVFFELETVWP